MIGLFGLDYFDFAIEASMTIAVRLGSTSPNAAMVTLFGKRTPVEDYRITSRGGIGIKNYGVTEKTGLVVGIKVVDGSEDLLVVTEKGVLIRTDVGTIKTCGRAAQGVIVMRFKEEDDQVISIALAEKEPEEESGEQEE